MRALQTGLFAALTLGGVVAIATTTTSTGCSNTSQVRQIFMALDGNGDRPRDTFFTDTTQIFCDVVFSAYSTDETLDVIWTQSKGEATLFEGTGNLQPVARNWGGSEGIPSPGVSTVAFPFQRPTAVDGGATVPFPVGDWTCNVYVNGQLGGTSNFHIVYPDAIPNTPDCPATGGAYTGMNCAAYKGGASCPNDSNTAGSMCTCQSYPNDVSDPSARAFVCQ